MTSNEEHDQIQNSSLTPASETTVPGLQRLEQARDSALNKNIHPETNYWNYFEIILINGSPGIQCKCCARYKSTSIQNPLMIMKSHLGNSSCEKYGGSAGVKAAQVIVVQFFFEFCLMWPS